MPLHGRRVLYFVADAVNKVQDGVNRIKPRSIFGSNSKTAAKNQGQPHEHSYRSPKMLLLSRPGKNSVQSNLGSSPPRNQDSPSETHSPKVVGGLFLSTTVRLLCQRPHLRIPSFDVSSYATPWIAQAPATLQVPLRLHRPAL